MTEEERRQFNKKIYEDSLALMKSFQVPEIIFRVCGTIYWLNELDSASIEKTIQSLWAFASLNNYRLTRDKFDYWLHGVEYELMHEMEKFNPDIIGTEEHELRFLGIELLINLCSTINITDEFVYVVPLSNETDMIERINEYKKNPKYQKMFTHKTKGEIYFQKYLEQYKAGVATEDIKVNMDEVEKEYELNKNEIRPKDKRVKYRDIDMIDADTKEVVHTFKDREECIEMTGISKSRLSQILASCKIYQQGIYKYNGWQSWKDKDSGKYYHFREKYKTD